MFKKERISTLVMNYRFPSACLLFLLLLALSAGCASAPVQPSVQTPAVTVTIAPGSPAPAGTAAPATESIAAQLASVKSGNAVFKEAYRMFRNMRSTEYVHPPYTVDNVAGIYRFDCLGFVDHVLMNASPASYKTIGKGVNPSIESYAAYFNKLDPAKPDTLGWTKVAHPASLLPGDVCLWLKPTTLDTGHMWIIAGTPSVNPKRTDEILVRIFDSSVAHSSDSRTGSPDKTGLGSGILGMMVDGGGNPIGLYWEGGESTAAGEKDTTIVCGRLNR
jgi:hypothetical protein